MLPEFIKEKETSWDFLKRSELPVFIYGMGDGAEKILRVFEEKNICAAGFFASDEFVRGHSFKGHTVHKLSEIERDVGEFAAVLAFGAGYPSLYEKIKNIAERHILLAPDVPVCGEGLFDLKFCEDNGEKLTAVYNMLADDISRNTFADVINFKISGKITYLDRCTADEDEIYGTVINVSDCGDYIDMGAYNGDTVLKFEERSGGRHGKIFALEPDGRNFRRLEKNTRHIENISLLNAAAWSENTVLPFSEKAGRQSAIDPQRPANRKEVPAVAGDSLTDSAGFIKMDVEGAEKEAVRGCERLLKKGASAAIALYHRNEDIFELPLLIHEINPELKLYIRHLLYIPAWETNLYCAKQKRSRYL